MELAEIKLLEPRLFEPQVVEPVLFGAEGGGYDSATKPYVTGHVTDGSTFTFKVNGSDVSVSVDANGNWKYKPTATITSLAFVGVPELDSLTLCKINGLQTFSLDYPVVPVFKNCDTTTQNALEYVYHIRGTATDNFQFTLKYVDDNNTVTTVTESAVIDGDGKWDVAYSGKKIKELSETFKENTYIKVVDITEALTECTTTYLSFSNSNLEELKSSHWVFGKLTDMRGMFFKAQSIEIIDLSSAILSTVVNVGGANLGAFYTWANVLKELRFRDGETFGAAENCLGLFYRNNSLATLDLKSATFAKITNSSYMFSHISNLIVPNNSAFPKTISFADCPLTYDSMLRVAGWLADLTGLTTQTVTFKQATYDALTAEQKATLEGIIVTQKHWTLTTV